MSLCYILPSFLVFHSYCLGEAGVDAYEWTVNGQMSSPSE